MPALWFPRDQREILNRRDNTTGLETDLRRRDVGLSQEWALPWRWEGDVQDPDGKTPFKLTCNDTLQQAGLPYIVRIRETVHRGLINNNKCSYRVYLEWCPYKDLPVLIDSCRNANDWIPEPFIWYIMEALAIAGCYMEEGKSPDSTSALHPNWEQIVHR
jgi:hypothetical protein